MIIAITGTPGTGKTEIAKLLAKKLDYKYVSLNEIADSNNLYEGYDEERNCKIVDLEKLSKEIEKISKSDNIIIDSHFSQDVTCDEIIVLRCKTNELRKRLENRGWKEKKIMENIEAEIMEICKEEALEKGKDVLEIDTTNKSVEETVNEILKLKRKL